MASTITFSHLYRVMLLGVGISLLLNIINLFRIPPQHVIKVGVLHSRTGVTALSEIPVMKATLVAIKEINKEGGLLGRPIEPIIADGKSDPIIFAREAKKLLTEDKVEVIFGCQTSATRKSVKPLVEQYNSLLFYPVEYEGLEESHNIVYTGAVTNQHSLPAVVWAMQRFGNRIYLIGSDYVYPHATNEIIKELVTRLGAEIIGEEYVSLNAEYVTDAVNKIVAARPSFIFSTIVGNTQVPFFAALKAQLGDHPIPIMSSSVDDSLVRVAQKTVAGSYNTWNYYESIEGAPNKKFITDIKNTYGKNQVMTDPMEAAYIGVHIWAATVKRAGSTHTETVLQSLQGTAFKAPEGFVSVKMDNHHLFKTVRIAQITDEGLDKILWTSRLPVDPEPYPNQLFIAQQLGTIRSVDDWNKYLEDLYIGWGEQWEAY